MLPIAVVRQLYVLSLLVACSEASPPGGLVAVTRSDLTPPPACSVTLSAETALYSYVEESAARWSLATGCDVRMGDGGVAFQLAPDLPFGEGGAQVPGWTQDDRRLVLINTRAREAQRERSVPHELGHVLGGYHTLSDGVLSGAKHRRNVIDAEGLGSVCATLDCQAFNPEAGE